MPSRRLPSEEWQASEVRCVERYTLKREALVTSARRAEGLVAQKRSPCLDSHERAGCECTVGVEYPRIRIQALLQAERAHRTWVPFRRKQQQAS